MKELKGLDLAKAIRWRNHVQDFKPAPWWKRPWHWLMWHLKGKHYWLPLLLLSASAWAQDSITPSTSGYWTTVTYNFTAAADGTAEGQTDSTVQGVVFSLATSPGTATDNYDIVLYQAFDNTSGGQTTMTSTDLLGGNGANRDDTNTELVELWPGTVNEVSGYPELRVTNAGNGGTGKIELFVYRTLVIERTGSGSGVPIAGATTQLLQWSTNGETKWITVSGEATIADGGAVNLQGDVDFTTVTTTGTVSSGGNVTVGSSGAGVDYTLTVDGEDSDGVLEWEEDEDRFQFYDDIVIGQSEAGVDYSISMDGETNNGALTYMEDEDRWDFAEDVSVLGGDLTVNSGGTGKVYANPASGAAILALGARPLDNAGASQVRVGRETNTAGTVTMSWFQGDGSATVKAEMNMATGDLQLDGDIAVDGFLRAAVSSELTIATGVITVTGSHHNIDTESDGASDDLDTINGGTNGDILILRATNGARTVVLKDDTGNLNLAGDFSLTHADDRVVLFFESANWYELSRSDNGT